MNSYERVVKGLEQCSNTADSRCNKNCPYYSMEFCESTLAGDALKLIKSQNLEFESAQTTIKNLMNQINLMVDVTRR